MGNGEVLGLLLSALVAVEVVLSFAVAPSEGAGLGFEFHHRFSDRVRQWAEERDLPGTWWPEKGTAEYYAALVHHDLAHARRGRLLAEGNEVSTFVDGNTTYRLSSLGYLHYANVTVGTPSLSFLVALDTGSDLFWLPCDCIQCAPASSPNYPGLIFDYYSPSNSSTSKNILCGDSLCTANSACPGANSSCPYGILYGDQSSTTGVLVEDVLYLKTEDTTPQVVQSPIVLGCGRNQSGSFLDSGAPNGLFGLGPSNISVPSILASKGLIPDTFSMCFGDDGIGRINFGDKGSSDQMETPLILSSSKSHYTIGITAIQVGNSTTAADFSIIVDSGTSFAMLDDPIYTGFTENFNSKVQEQRHVNDPSIPFEFCYDLSPSQSSILLPIIELTANGGSTIQISDPIILIVTQTQSIYCLAVIKSSINILGQNFLTGLRVVFDKERSIFGWKKFNCYKVESTNNLNLNKTAPTPTAASPGSFSSSDKQNSGSIVQVGTKKLSSATSLSVPSLLLILLAISWLCL